MTEDYGVANNVAGSKYRQRLHEKFFQLYGAECACCGETCREFLSIDHVQGDGAEMRKLGGEPYRSLRIALKEYNPAKYQTLCMNCNAGRSRNGGICPHQNLPPELQKSDEGNKEIVDSLDLQNTEYLTCCECKESKERAEFHNSAATKTGCTRRCKRCYSGRNKRWRHSSWVWKTQKKCVECGNNFLPQNPAQAVCSTKCRRQRQTRNYLKSKAYIRTGKNRRRRQRTQFLDMYGHACACCGEADEIFLTLDHVQNDGNIERQQLGKEPSKMLDLALERYNPEKYQVLCYNCNMGKRVNGGVCPHKTDKKTQK